MANVFKRLGDWVAGWTGKQHDEEPPMTEAEIRALIVDESKLVRATRMDRAKPRRSDLV
jgi:hypothetical protein